MGGLGANPHVPGIHQQSLWSWPSKLKGVYDSDFDTKAKCAIFSAGFLQLLKRGNLWEFF